MAVVSFTDYVPTPRFDGIPWTVIRIEESVISVGPWTLIDTINITDPDVDPSQPQERSFSTRNATLDQGWYRVTFVDANGAIVQADPVQNAPSDEAAFIPSLRDVALKLLSRTRDKFGKQVGTFNADTTPNELDALGIIRQAALDVADEIGDDIPPELQDDAADLVATKAAMQIELSFFSDQVNTGRSIYPQLEKEYERQFPALQRQVSMIKEGETGVSDAGASTRASWGFPTSSDWMKRVM